MKINEVCSPLNTYIASVRVVTTDGSTTVRTTITADNQQNARLMLTRMYGHGNVLFVQSVLDEEVTEATKTLSPQELQVKSLSDRAKQLTQQAKQAKARESLQKAQDKLRQASAAAAKQV